MVTTCAANQMHQCRFGLTGVACGVRRLRMRLD
jgi:hypothetical protein